MNTTKVATFAYIINDKNKVLLIRRAPHDSFPGRWELPGGGLDSGESPDKAIEREVEEETGLRVKALKPLSVINHRKYNEKDLIRITFECMLLDPDEEVKLSADHDAYRWVDLPELYEIGKNTPLKDIVLGIQNIYPPTAA